MIEENIPTTSQNSYKAEPEGEDPHIHRFESRERTIQRFEMDSTFYLNGILFRIHKLLKKSIEVRPVKGAPRHKAQVKGGRLPLSLPKPGGECGLCGGKVPDYSTPTHNKKEEDKNETGI